MANYPIHPIDPLTYSLAAYYLAEPADFSWKVEAEASTHEHRGADGEDGSARHFVA